MTGSPQATILLVEDSRERAEVIARELAANGYRVVRAPDGRIARELHPRERPDLLILDWMLPGMSGLAVDNAVFRLRKKRGPWRFRVAGSARRQRRVDLAARNGARALDSAHD